MELKISYNEILPNKNLIVEKSNTDKLIDDKLFDENLADKELVDEKLVQEKLTDENLANEELITDIIKVKILYNEKYQEFFLKKAINEVLDNYNNSEKEIIINKINIKINHLKGINYINKNIILPIIFPLYIKEYILSLKKEKTIDYNFIGLISLDRHWLLKYKSKNSVIINSRNGRNKNIKYNIDTEYYDTLCKSNFTLSPTGTCPWSYRFFEAIMCLSIPVLENNSNDIYMNDYFYYFDRDIHIYYEEKAIDNYNKFINSKHFLKTNIFEDFIIKKHNTDNTDNTENIDNIDNKNNIDNTINANNTDNTDLKDI